MKRLLVGLLLVGVLATAGAMYFASAANDLPSWYEPEAAAEAPPPSGLFGALSQGFGSLPPSLLMRLAELSRAGRAELDSAEVQGLMLAWAATDADGRKVLDAAEELQAHVEGDRIEIGGRFNLSRIDAEGLGTDGRRALEMARQYLFFVSDNPVYVGIDARATLRDDRIFVEDDIAVRVGSLTVPRFLVQRALRLDDGRLAEGFAVDVARYGVATARIEGDRVVVVAR